MNRRNMVRTAVAGVLGGMVYPGFAQARPITIIAGYAPGSSIDLVARKTGERLAASLSKTVIVDNKTGAGGQLALTAVAAATADGNTLAFTPQAPLTIFPATNDKLPYAVSDFAPVAATCTAASCLVVSSAHPAKTLQEFVTWAKANPTSIGNPGHATAPHFTSWRFARAAGIDVQHAPYRAIPQLAVDVVSGQVTAGLAAMPAFVELIKGGRLRLLATAGEKRSSLFPESPTFIEAGFPEIVQDDWYGFVASSRVPQKVRDDLATVLQSISRESEYRAALQAMGLTVEYLNGATLAKRVKDESAKWVELVKLSGFKSTS